jgi:tetratricopeptide (TPR) repeat protein
VNTFFSSSAASDVALAFQTGAFGKPYFECVVFEMLVTGKTDSIWKVPFADIRNVSFNKGENEVLFGMGSMFRIVDVKQWTDDLWLVNLTLLENSGNDESLREYYLANNIGQKSSVVIMTQFLELMGQISQAKHYCELLVREHLSDYEKLEIYTHLAYYEYRLNDLVAAKRSGELALELQNSLQLTVPTIYSHMGLILGELGEYNKAIEYH